MKYWLAALWLVAESTTPCWAEPVSLRGQPVQMLVDRFGPPTEIHEPWRIMQQEELSKKSDAYLDGSIYSSTKWVGRPSNPDYKNKLSTYIFNHPPVGTAMLACNLEVMVDPDGNMMGTGTLCPDACHSHLKDFLKDPVDPACLR